MYDAVLRVPDVNVLVYAHRPDVEDSEIYADWLDRHVNSGREFGMSGAVLCGFVRVVTGVKFPSGATPKAEALEFCDRFTASLRCRLIQPGGAHWRIFGELCRKISNTGKGISDASHAATAIEHSVEWVTNDHGFANYPGLRWRHLPSDEIFINPG